MDHISEEDFRKLDLSTQLELQRPKRHGAKPIRAAVVAIEQGGGEDQANPKSELNASAILAAELENQNEQFLQDRKMAEALSGAAPVPVLFAKEMRKADSKSPKPKDIDDPITASAILAAKLQDQFEQELADKRLAEALAEESAVRKPKLQSDKKSKVDDLNASAILAAQLSLKFEQELADRRLAEALAADSGVKKKPKSPIEKPKIDDLNASAILAAQIALQFEQEAKDRELAESLAREK
jgi:hypothetical protein